METNGTTMNPGVATPVANSMRSSEAHSVGEKKAQVEPASPEQSRRVSVSEEIQTIEPKVRQDETGTADALIVIAKRDGVDEALAKLAQDEGIQEEAESGSANDGVRTEDAQEEELEDEEVERKPSLLDREVQELAAKVEKLAETNSDIKKRLEQTEEMNKVAVFTIYELAQILKKMIEESEEKNRENLLIILVRIMAKLMEMMFVPNEEDGVADGKTSEERQLERLAA